MNSCMTPLSVQESFGILFPVPSPQSQSLPPLEEVPVPLLSFHPNILIIGNAIPNVSRVHFPNFQSRLQTIVRACFRTLLPTAFSWLSSVLRAKSKFLNIIEKKICGLAPALQPRVSSCPSCLSTLFLNRTSNTRDVPCTRKSPPNHSSSGKSHLIHFILAGSSPKAPSLTHQEIESSLSHVPKTRLISPFPL